MILKDFMCNIPVYIINLEDSIDRKKSVLNEFEGYNNIKFIEAVDGRNYHKFKNEYDIKYNSITNYSSSLIAVICSHIKAIKIAYENNLDKVCIFEDDVHNDLITSCDFTLDDICNLNEDWEAIQLFGTSGNLDVLSSLHHNYKENGLRLIKRDLDYAGTCYIINRKGMENLLNNYFSIDSTKTKIEIKNIIINPENSILGNINTYIINRLVFYYYFPTMTYDNYREDTNNDKEKIICQIIHLNTKNILQSFYCNTKIL
jgi:hypothetical protein